MHLEMKLVSITFLLFIIFSCNKENESLIEYKVTLENELGTIVLNLPKDFDSTYRVTEFSDYTNDEIICHYFSSHNTVNIINNYPDIDFYSDSFKFYSLFISQPKLNRQRIDSNLLEKYARHSSNITYLNSDDVTVLKQENIEINERSFYIIGTMMKIGNKISWTLYAQTIIHDQIITLVYQRLSNQSSSCFTEMFESIKSIRIEN